MIYLAPVPEKKRLHEAAWQLLACGLGGGALPPVRLGPHGKPFLEGGPHISISHTKGLALCAIEDWNTGLDAERRRVFPPHLQERVFTLGERELARNAPDPDSLFTTLWTLKESYMKYTGLGLAEGAGSLSFCFEGGRPVLEGKDLCFCTTVWKGFYISQCGPGPFELTLCPVDLHEN